MDRGTRNTWQRIDGAPWPLWYLASLSLGLIFLKILLLLGLGEVLSSLLSLFAMLALLGLIRFLAWR